MGANLSNSRRQFPLFFWGGAKVSGATSRMAFWEFFVVNRDLTYHSAIFHPVNVTHFAFFRMVVESRR